MYIQHLRYETVCQCCNNNNNNNNITSPPFAVSSRSTRLCVSVCRLPAPPRRAVVVLRRGGMRGRVQIVRVCVCVHLTGSRPCDGPDGYVTVCGPTHACLQQVAAAKPLSSSSLSPRSPRTHELQAAVVRKRVPPAAHAPSTRAVCGLSFFGIYIYIFFFIDERII